MSARSAPADTPAPEASRLIPQAWLDRATQIERAAEGLFAAVVDALAVAEQETGRLDAAIVALLDQRSHALIQALHLPRPPLDQPGAVRLPTEPEPDA